MPTNRMDAGLVRAALVLALVGMGSSDWIADRHTAPWYIGKGLTATAFGCLGGVTFWLNRPSQRKPGD